MTNRKEEKIAWNPGSSILVDSKSSAVPRALLHEGCRRIQGGQRAPRSPVPMVLVDSPKPLPSEQAAWLPVPARLPGVSVPSHAQSVHMLEPTGL